MPKYKVLRFDAPPHPSPNFTFHLTARIKKSIVYVRLYYVYIFFVSLEVLPEECWSNRWCHRCCQQFDGRVTLHSRLKWNNHHRTKQHIFFGACEATFEKTPNRSNFLPLTSYSLPTVCDAPEVSQSKKKEGNQAILSNHAWAFPAEALSCMHEKFQKVVHKKKNCSGMGRGEEREVGEKMQQDKVSMLILFPNTKFVVIYGQDFFTFSRKLRHHTLMREVQRKDRLPKYPMRTDVVEDSTGTTCFKVIFFKLYFQHFQFNNNVKYLYINLLSDWNVFSSASEFDTNLETLGS